MFLKSSQTKEEGLKENKINIDISSFVLILGSGLNRELFRTPHTFLMGMFKDQDEKTFPLKICKLV